MGTGPSIGLIMLMKGRGVQNFGKHGDVIVERSLRIYLAEIQFYYCSVETICF